jgi:hypothetical protein
MELVPGNGNSHKREELPLFGKEGRGEIFGKIYLLNYGLVSKLKIENGINLAV